MAETTAGEKIRTRKTELIVTIPDTRGVEVNPWMKGNLKLGPDVWSYSRLPGRPTPHGGTCPGASPGCISVCYAFRIDGLVKEVYARNSNEPVPPLPEGAKFVRLHVSGDFDSVQYICQWWKIAKDNPQTRFWAYTRSWRVPELVGYLETLRQLPNFQLFASMDNTIKELPPEGWRRSWLSTDFRAGMEPGDVEHGIHNRLVEDGEYETMSYLCPEETKRQPSCQSCRYCFDGKKGDVTFIEH